MLRNILTFFTPLIVSGAAFAQSSPADIEALMDKCFDRKVAEIRKLGGSVLGTMIPAIQGECKTEIDAAKGTISGSKAAQPANTAASTPKAATPQQKYANMDQFIAPEICAEYADNPIAADKQFKGKLVKIYGPIERIAVDAFGTPFILISGRPVRCSVRLNFPKNKVSSLEELRRGEFITAVCKAKNKILSEVVTDECQLL